MKFLLIFPSLLGKLKFLLSDWVFISGSDFAAGYLFWNSFLVKVKLWLIINIKNELPRLSIMQSYIPFYTKNTFTVVNPTVGSPLTNKLGSLVRMVIDSILPHAECGPNDHREDASPFNLFVIFGITGHLHIVMLATSRWWKFFDVGDRIKALEIFDLGCRR